MVEQNAAQREPDTEAPIPETPARWRIIAWQTEVVAVEVPEILPVILLVLPPTPIPVAAIVEFAPAEIIAAIAVPEILTSEALVVVETLTIVELITVLVEAPVLPEVLPVVPTVLPEVLPIVTVVPPEILPIVAALLPEVAAVIALLHLHLWGHIVLVLERVAISTAVLAEILAIPTAILAEFATLLLLGNRLFGRRDRKHLARLTRRLLLVLLLDLCLNLRLDLGRGLNLRLTFLTALKTLLLDHARIRATLCRALLTECTAVLLRRTFAHLALGTAIPHVILCHGGGGDQSGCRQ
ncbi:MULTISPECIES: hypothetical protein [unclassified Sphingomonas]|uniref:hypothetical protein n=1 Tax=unclassified Sphingomonas TaxID=196159 RepID=UPI0035A831B3